MNIIFNAIVTHLIGLKTLKSKKKNIFFTSGNPTKALSWTHQGFSLGFVQQVDGIPLETLLKEGH